MEDPQELSIRDLLEILRKGLLIGLALALTAAVVAFVLSEQGEPVFQSRVTLLASQPGAATEDFGVSLVTAPPVDVAAYRAAALSMPVLSSALTQIVGPDVTPGRIADLRNRTTVRTEETRVSALVHVEVRAQDATKAREEAAAIGRSLLDWDRGRATRNLEKIIDTLSAQISSLDSQIADVESTGTVETDAQVGSLQSLRARHLVQLNSARALRSSAVGRLEVLEPASLPLLPVPDSPIRNAVLAFMVVFFVNYMLFFVREALDTRLRSTEDLARSSGLPVLAEFPNQAGMRRLPREASGYLRTNLQFLTASNHPKVILVTSSNSEHGKSSVALSLAESLVRNGYRTLLVDADLRKPVLAGEYGLDERVHTPLRTFLESPDEDFATASVLVDNRAELRIIPSFAPAANPSELLSQGFPKFIQKQMHIYDAIVIDSAPVLPVADTLTIAPHTTGIVFAVSMADADRRLVKAALEMLQRLGVSVLGVVATRTASEKSKGVEGYGYGYGYGYGQVTDDLDDGTRAPAPVHVGAN